MLNPYLNMLLSACCFIVAIIFSSIKVNQEEPKKKLIKESILWVLGFMFFLSYTLGDIVVQRYGKEYTENIDYVETTQNGQFQYLNYVITEDIHKIYITDEEIDTQSGTNQITYKKLLGRTSVIHISLTQDALDEVLLSKVIGMKGVNSNE